MTQNALNRAVARATGEAVGLIRQVGFVLDRAPSGRRRRRGRHAGGEHANGTKPTTNVSAARPA